MYCALQTVLNVGPENYKGSDPKLTPPNRETSSSELRFKDNIYTNGQHLSHWPYIQTEHFILIS
jgi:hypothetical protein